MNENIQNYKWVLRTKNKRFNNWLSKSNKVHDNKYDYSLVEYTNNKNKVKIICPEHGEFEQRPDDHARGRGCYRCSGLGKTQKEALTDIKSIHKNKYEYPNFKYNGYKSNITAICPEHGEFIIQYGNHRSGKGCFKCAGYKIVGGNLTNRLTTEEFIIKSDNIHDYRYDYSLVEYIRSNDKVIIICPEHGKFKQTPNSHLRGSGCNKCNSSRGETVVRNYLNRNNIKYTEQFKLEKYFLDFYLDELNIAIEYDGIQHFKPVEYFGGDSEFKLTTERDKIKNKLCEESNINLIRISYLDFKNIESILKEKIPV